MALTILTGSSQAAGVNYSYSTSGSADWSSVPTASYFYDIIDKTVRYKSPNGDIQRFDTFPFTGSALITGSLGVTGSASILATTLTTSSIFNVRNSASTANIIEARGNASIVFANGVSTYSLNPRTDADGFSLNSGNGLYGTGTGMEVVSNQFLINNSGVRTFRFSGATVSNVWILHNESNQLRICPTTDTTDPIVNLNGTTRFVGVGILTPAARLDVRAQGALSTDIAFRVRNSADSNNIFTVSGNNTIKFLSQTSSFDGIVMSQGAFSAPIMTFSDVFSEAIRISTVTNVIKAGNFRMGAETGDGFGGLISTSTSPAQGRFFRIVDNFGTQWLNIGGSSFDGTDMGLTMRASTNTNTNYIRFRGFGNANEVTISDQANVGIGGTSYGTSSKYVIAQYTGTAPTTSPADAFQQYSADITAGNAAPHFRTENGSIIKLYKETQPALSGSANTGDPATDALIEAMKTIILNLGLGASS
jgi:hypothetical protein